MSIKDLEITDQNVQSVYVQSQPDRLTGTAQQNKAVFDALPQLIRQRFNELLEALAGTGAAGEIPVSPIEGVTAENVQQALEAIQKNLTAYINKIKSEIGAAEVGVSTISGISAGNVQKALEGLRAIQITLDSNIQKLMSANGAEAVGVNKISGMQAQNVQKALEELRKAIDDSVSGIIPGGSIKPDMIDGPIPIKKGGTEADTAQKAIAFLGAGVRPNLLDNAIFIGGGTAGNVPVNQQGKAEYTGQVSTIDRWSMIGTAGRLTLKENGAYFEKTADETSYAGLDEKIPLGHLEGKELTLSCLVDGVCYCDTVGAGWSSDLLKTIQIGTETKYMILNVTRVDDTLRTRFYYGGAASASSTGFLLQAVKLEIGSTQTLAYQDTDGTWKLLPQPESDYVTQIMKCKYYATMIGNGHPVRLQADYITNNALYFSLPVDVQLRNVNPTIVSSDLLNVYSGSIQSGFVFSAYNAGNCIVIAAAKQDHGLSGGMLQMKMVWLNCEL